MSGRLEDQPGCRFGDGEVQVEQDAGVGVGALLRLRSMGVAKRVWIPGQMAVASWVNAAAIRSASGRSTPSS